MDSLRSFKINRALDKKLYVTAAMVAGREERFEGNLTHPGEMPTMEEFVAYMKGQGYIPLNPLPDDSTTMPTGGVLVNFTVENPPSVTGEIMAEMRAARSAAKPSDEGGAAGAVGTPPAKPAAPRSSSEPTVLRNAADDDDVAAMREHLRNRF